jgi:hypothetical protein
MLALGEGSNEDLLECLRCIADAGGDSDDDDGEDLQEGLEMAKEQGVETMSVLKVLRDGDAIPLSHCVDFVAEKLDAVQKREAELLQNIYQYADECGRLEREIAELDAPGAEDFVVDGVNVSAMVRTLDEGGAGGGAGGEGQVGGEEFWRAVNGQKDRFEAIAQFWGRGVFTA